ncbi:MAG TPA: N-acetylmuramic acid 6-phosphate etherase [Bacteroidetes bacterium]|nr:N-acetylmuramic acid 6-phosphate etherase [Bacteroidota bacterium]
MKENASNKGLEGQSLPQLLEGMHATTLEVYQAIDEAMPQIEEVCELVYKALESGGRLFYLGAGTSGRLGILDASECPPTFGSDPEQVVGLIAGGDQAIRNAVEFAEDDEEQAYKDLVAQGIRKEDVVVGIAASGNTPYVVGGLRNAQQQRIATACITCNAQGELLAYADKPIVVYTGEEFIHGSTRLKAGSAQKLILNMITTTSYIRLGHVQGRFMIDMQLANNKLWKRGIDFIMKQTNLSAEEARHALKKHGSVRKTMQNIHNA